MSNRLGVSVRRYTFAGAPLQLSETSLHERKLPAHSVRDLDHVKLQLVARLHPRSGHTPPGQHHCDRGAAVGAKEASSESS